MHLEIDPLVEEGIKVVIEEITTIGTITGQIIEIDLEADGITIGQVIGVVITQITIDEVMRDQTTDKTPNGLLEIEVKVGIEMRIMTLEVEVETEIIEEERNPGLNHDHVRCYRCREYDHFVAECPNTPTGEETDYEDADPTSLQMMSQNYSPDYSEREADYLNL